MIAKLAQALAAERAHSRQLEQIVEELRDEVEDLDGELAALRRH